MNVTWPTSPMGRRCLKCISSPLYGMTICVPRLPGMETTKQKQGNQVEFATPHSRATWKRDHDPPCGTCRPATPSHTELVDEVSAHLAGGAENGHRRPVHGAAAATARVHQRVREAARKAHGGVVLMCYRNLPRSSHQSPLFLPPPDHYSRAQRSSSHSAQPHNLALTQQAPLAYGLWGGRLCPQSMDALVCVCVCVCTLAGGLGGLGELVAVSPYILLKTRTFWVSIPINVI